MPNAPKSRYPNGKPGTPPDYHPFGTYYVDGKPGKITGASGKVGTSDRKFRFEPYDALQGRWVRPAEVSKQPHPPRVRPPYTSRGYAASKDRNRTAKPSEFSRAVRALVGSGR